MNKLIAVLCFALAMAPAMAQDKPKSDEKKPAVTAEKAKKEPTEKQKAQQERMKGCNDKATEKKGEERKKFMSSCLKGEDAAPAKKEPTEKQKAQQDKMKACSTKAEGKKGDERKKYMSECLKG